MTPLRRGTGRDVIGENIGEELRAGKPRKQAIAIALNEARRSGARTPKPTREEIGPRSHQPTGPRCRERSSRGGQCVKPAHHSGQHRTQAGKVFY